MAQGRGGNGNDAVMGLKSRSLRINPTFQLVGSGSTKVRSEKADREVAALVGPHRRGRWRTPVGDRFQVRERGDPDDIPEPDALTTTHVGAWRTL